MEGHSSWRDARVVMRSAFDCGDGDGDGDGDGSALMRGPAMMTAIATMTTSPSSDLRLDQPLQHPKAALEPPIPFTHPLGEHPNPGRSGRVTNVTGQRGEAQSSFPAAPWCGAR